MIIKPKSEEKLGGNYVFGAKTFCQTNSVLIKPIFKEFWHRFCCNSGDIEFISVKDFSFKVGDVGTLPAPQSGFTFIVNKSGISLSASDEKNLIYGFFAMIEKIRPICTKKGEESFAIECCNVFDDAKVKTRMAHVCIFPETPIFFIKKIMRVAAFFRYTHIIFEFWGMLKFNCLKELAWKEGYSKEQIKPIIQEANDLGLEVVPMFNHWGHAPGASVSIGKHVVLDQNLSLAPLFSDTGWEWNISNPEVVKLQEEIRAELIELCGKGEFFHIGCDEAYSAKTEGEFVAVVEYINSVAEKLEKQGRKTIMWGDMLLHKDVIDKKTENSYYLLSHSKEMQKLLIDKLSRSIIIADWQYDAINYPLETSIYFKEKGFRVLSCPWDRNNANLIVSASTIKENDLMGVMHTTWNSLETMWGMMRLVNSAVINWTEDTECVELDQLRIELSTIIRKIDFPDGEYQKGGWKRKFI